MRQPQLDRDHPADFDHFVDARGDALLRTAYLLTHDLARAEDLLQTALVKALTGWDKVRPAAEQQVRATLLRSYASRWQRRWDDAGPRAELIDVPSGDEHEIDAWTTLGLLPRVERAAVVRQFVEGHADPGAAAVLAAHARDDVPATGPAGVAARLASVRAGTRAYRRRRAAGLLVVVLLVALLVDLAPKPWLDDARPDRRTAPDAAFPAFDGDDPLTASALGPVGRTDVEVRFTPTDANLRIAYTCSGAEGGAIVAGITLNGHPVVGAACGDASIGGFTHSVDAARNRAEFARDGAAAGRESVLRIAYTGRYPGTVRLGVAVYELTGPGTVVGGRRLRRAITLDGRRYQLFAYSAVALTEAPVVGLPGRYGNDLVACFGSSGGHGEDTLLINDRVYSTGTAGDFSCQPLAAGTNRTIGARSSNGATGSLVLAVYSRQGA